MNYYFYLDHFIYFSEYFLFVIKNSCPYIFMVFVVVDNVLEIIFITFTMITLYF